MSALALAFASAAHAGDPPSFDRPGIAFSTGTLPAGSFDWEQGLPDFSRDRSDGVDSTAYSADTLLRAGLTDALELQLGFSAFNASRERGAGIRSSHQGAGDTRVALKYALPSSRADFSWALLAGATVATGDTAFSNGRDHYQLGTAAQWSLDDAHAFGLYANADFVPGSTSLVLSPGYSIALDDRFGVFVEAGYTKATHAPADIVAGGGVAWMATHHVQLDLSADVGLTRDSTDLQGGFGVSVYFP